MSEVEEEAIGSAERDRRAFLKLSGRFAVVVPPTMTLLLSTSMSSDAIAASAGSPVGGAPVANAAQQRSGGGAYGAPNPFPAPGGGVASGDPALAGPVGGLSPAGVGPRPNALVAGSQDFNPAPLINSPSSKVAGSGERG